MVQGEASEGGTSVTGVDTTQVTAAGTSANTGSTVSITTGDSSSSTSSGSSSASSGSSSSQNATDQRLAVIGALIVLVSHIYSLFLVLVTLREYRRLRKKIDTRKRRNLGLDID